MFLLAVKTGKDYTADSYDQDLNRLCEGVEYGDAKSDEYQIWSVDDGKIYRLLPDRDIPASEYYSTPYGKNGVIWLPKIQYIGDDLAKISSAFVELQRKN